MTKVSIMLPTYNHEIFIEDCLVSILKQDYEDLEIVVSDDASTDNTIEIVKKIATSYPGKIIISENSINIGITKNCNKALQKCTGEYICLFAGDDIMLPGKIAEQVQLLNNDHEAAICYHRVEVFSSSDNQRLYETEHNRSIYSAFDLIKKAGLPGANSAMVRRKCIPAGGYDERIGSVSDWLFFIEIALRGKIIFSNKILARYRKHEAGCSAKADSLLDETLETVNILERRFNGDRHIMRVCKQAKVRYLLGTVARLVLSRNPQKLVQINTEIIRNVSMTLYYIVLFYCNSGLINTRFGSFIYWCGNRFLSRR